eukprot:gene27108-22519_t
MLKSDAMHASFWTATPQNIWRNNVAVNSEDRGMWFEFCDAESRVCDNTGPTYEFKNNIFHHNQGIGWRNYPHYLPSTPQYFYNNTFHHNGGNGFPNANPDSYFDPNIK